MINEEQDQFILDLPKVYADDFSVGGIFEVVGQDGEFIFLKRVYTTTKIAADEPPALGVRAAETVGTREKLG